MEQIDNEVWLPVKGFEELYEISNFGRVKSLDKVLKIISEKYTANQRFKGRLLKPFSSTNKKRDGYALVKLCRQTVEKTKKIHRLVAEAFIPNPNNLLEVNHKNGIKIDNRTENLEWCTRLENIRHSFDTGLNKGSIGEKNTFCKLTEVQVIEIKEMLRNGISYKDIAMLYPVNENNIRHISNGSTWKHIK